MKPIKCLGFNYLDDSLEAREIESNFQVVNEYWINTSVGPLMAAEVWLDTELNRSIIDSIIQEKQNLRQYKNQMAARVYKLVHTKDK